ncbi:unnamed protein product [Closterium sp. Naga37s-1]|nr:unnamed protein product [Closterium sp. Naga37s-1]
MGGKWGAISKLHAFPKAEDHLTQKTLSGAIVTLLGVAIMVVLFAHELSFVFTPEVHEEMAVDKTPRDEKLDVYLNISFPSLPCNVISLDALDMSGNHEVDIATNMYKIRLDRHGQLADSRWLKDPTGAWRQSKSKKRKGHSHGKSPTPHHGHGHAHGYGQAHAAGGQKGKAGEEEGEEEEEEGDEVVGLEQMVLDVQKAMAAGEGCQVRVGVGMFVGRGGRGKAVEVVDGGGGSGWGKGGLEQTVLDVQQAMAVGEGCQGGEGVGGGMGGVGRATSTTTLPPALVSVPPTFDPSPIPSPFLLPPFTIFPSPQPPPLYGHLSVERESGGQLTSPPPLPFPSLPPPCYFPFPVTPAVFSSVGDVNMSHIIHSLGFEVLYFPFSFHSTSPLPPLSQVVSSVDDVNMSHIIHYLGSQCFPLRYLSRIPTASQPPSFPSSPTLIAFPHQVFSSVGDVNVSHVIHSLGFGVPYPGRLNPLDGFVRILPPLKEGEDPARSSGTFKYFLKVVPTRLRFWHGGTVKTNQYSISEYFTPSSPQSNALPAVYFLYDLSPIAVSITESHRSFFHFLTRLCAVLGGTFALTGMLDRWVYSLLQLFNRPRHAYGKATRLH